MSDLFGSMDNVYYSASESSSNEASSMTRPSGKAIYLQRKEYIESMINKQNTFQHRVEHLLTSYMNGKDICNVENCIERLKMMSAEGQVWGQDMFLQVKNQNLLLTDIEAEEELDSYPLECIQECVCILDSCIYNSILAITVKEMKLHRTSIMLFQCEQLGAQLMKTKLEKAIEEWRGEQQNQHLLRNNLENILHRHRQASFNDNPYRIIQDKRAAPLTALDYAISQSKIAGQKQEQQPLEVSSFPMDYKREAEQQQREELAWDDARFQATQHTSRATEILNHVLSDIEIFVGKLQQTSDTLNDKKKKKKSKKKKNEEMLPSELEFKECFQKIKYSFNLLAMLEHTLQEPSAEDLIHLIFSTLSTILSNCPWAKLAPAVDSPLLTPAAVSLLKCSLNSDEQAAWKSLGDAWSLTRSEYSNGDSIPPYIPIFSDGWVPPTPTGRKDSVVLNMAHNRSQNTFSDRYVLFSNRVSYSPRLMQATSDFHARNPRELIVMKGDLLEVLDQQKKWWLARNSAGETGYIPNNILEPMEQKAPKGNSMEQAAELALQDKVRQYPGWQILDAAACVATASLLLPPLPGSYNPPPQAGEDLKSIPDLRPTSSPAEVTAWLKSNGFSDMTIKSLGVLKGSQLLSMSQKDLTTVCPEEGKRIFFKLSAVKLALE